MKTLAFFVAIFVTGSTFATEVDNTSVFYEPIVDSERLLNEKTEQLIANALRNARGCDRRVLARRLYNQLVGNLIYGTVEAYANDAAEVDRRFLTDQQSIYAHTPYVGTFVATFVNLGPTVNVAGIQVGTDKLGHFMDMGYDLFRRARRGDQIEDLLRQSRREQSGLWGMWMTGVKSYGDIAANFDGFRFWSNLVNEGPQQYFACENNQLKQVRAFRWSDYVNPAWNEAINCNEYWGDSYAVPIKRFVTELEARTGRRYQCPILPQECPRLRELYGQWVPEHLVGEIISPDCR